MDNNRSSDKIVQHYTSVVRDGILFIAKCSCGWVSERQAHRFLAENEATDHVVSAG